MCAIHVVRTFDGHFLQQFLSVFILGPLNQVSYIPNGFCGPKIVPLHLLAVLSLTIELCSPHVPLYTLLTTKGASHFLFKCCSFTFVCYLGFFLFVCLVGWFLGGGASQERFFFSTFMTFTNPAGKTSEAAQRQTPYDVFFEIVNKIVWDGV